LRKSGFGGERKTSSSAWHVASSPSEDVTVHRLSEDVYRTRGQDSERDE